MRSCELRMTVPLNIACGYRDGVLSGVWFQLVRRLRSRMERARLDVGITLVPLSAVPANANFLVVPGALTELARRVAGNAEVVAIPAGSAEKALAEFVERLRDEAPPKGADPQRLARTVIRRGFEVVPWPTD